MIRTNSTPEPNQVRQPNRRLLLRWLVGLSILAPAVGAGYARFVEPAFIRRREIRLPVPRLPEPFEEMKIAHISDIHYGTSMTEARVRRLVDHVQASQPHLICLTGDLVDRRKRPASDLVPALRRLTAPLGNHDYDRGAHLASAALRSAGFDVLTNGGRHIRRRGDTIAIAGIDDALDGLPNMRKALREIAADTCCILLAHEPEWGDVSLSYPIDVQLSGLSHGGQVRLPVLGPLFLPEWGERYPDGRYELNRDAADLPSRLVIYTSRGVGTSRLPIRLFYPPEWALLTLTRERVS